jgi:DNA-binding beta-propeller fold protein YncE
MTDAFRKRLDTPIRLLILFIGVQLFLAGCWYAEDPGPPSYKRVHTIGGLAGDIGEPFGIAIREDVVFVSDGASGTIRKITGDGKGPVMFAGGLNTPSGLALLPNGDLVVADTGSHTIRTISTNGTVTILAGVDGVPGNADGSATQATFRAPVGVAVGADGAVYVSDTYNDRIRVIRDRVVSTIAGGARGFADDVTTNAQFDTPLGIAVWGDMLLVADSGNARLRIVDRTGLVSTLAGTGQNELRDGTLSSAGFVSPTAVTVNDRGEISIADGNAIRVIGRRAFPFVETLAGDRRGFADGNTAVAKFSRPSGLAVDSGGELYVADSDNQRVRVISDREQTLTAGADESPLRSEAFPLADRWPYDPASNIREVAGTLGEIRGEIGPANRPTWFHNGLDIAGAYGETAKFIRTETVLDPHSAQNFGTARELLRLPLIGYIHLRLGRDSNDVPFGDERFQFERDDLGQLVDVRVPRGERFSAGETLGTLNSQNHVHLIAGRSGSEINALAALRLPGVSDSIAPTIEDVSLFDKDWGKIETEAGNNRIKLTDRTRIVARAYDRMDGNSERRRLGVYKIGYQIIPDGSTSGEVDWTIEFDRMPSNDAVSIAYAPGSRSGATGGTVFNYIASNRLSGDQFSEDFLDPATLAAGRYVLRIFAADFFGNTASKDIELEVLK